ncbi:DUF2155 domain-containing protein [Methylocapsa palsarum]|uniref:DUF2155 domain-containing protein n=1 Tax=Methylocapsa palsarum TaxID=1612308 RepID=A0A1I3ZLY1_9HYPH|nr:DUF2155 domain-containing protein [Methylocapsa palsarum]SFK44960.1 hypothetical protein SAMN05444581_10839 [Methylocapsa palsarum]
MLASAPLAKADKIKHPIAVFTGLDKITGRIIAFEVATDETVQFGSLQITQRACLTRPATEAPQTTTFVEVDEVDAKNEYKRIFSGWMYAASPGLHAIEHPVYDIWLTDCQGGGEAVVSPPEPAAADTPAAPLENAQSPDGAGSPEDAAKTQAEEAKAKAAADRARRIAAKKAAAEKARRMAPPNEIPGGEPPRGAPAPSPFPPMPWDRPGNGGR